MDGVGLYDYGARMYDAAIGRWTSIDPLAEIYVSYSSYSYVLGNPISLIDPDGMRVSLFERMANQIGGESDESQQKRTGEYREKPKKDEAKENIKPSHVFAQISVRATVSSGLGGTGSVAVGVVASHENGNWDYAVYLSVSAGVSTGTPGGIGGLELGGGNGNLDDFGGWGWDAGFYIANWFRTISFEGTTPYENPAPDKISVSGLLWPSKQFGKGAAGYIEPLNYTVYLKRTDDSGAIIDYIMGALHIIPENKRTLLANKLSELQTLLLKN